ELRKDWARLLGDVEPKGPAKEANRKTEEVAGVVVERVALEVEKGITVPLLLLMKAKPDGRMPVVVGLAQGGKQAFLAERADALAELVDGGVAVCLPDVRGIGETHPADKSRGRSSTDTDVSSTELMLGQTLVGSRLRDLRSVLAYLRTRKELDG